MGVIKDIRGQRFGLLRVPDKAEPEMRDGHAYWPVICDCGTRKWVRGSKLREGRIVSCGCQRADPGVRRAIRRGPDHEDDALEALRPYFEPMELDTPPEHDLDTATPPPAGAGMRHARSAEEIEAIIYGTPLAHAEPGVPDNKPPDSQEEDKPSETDWDVLGI